jgi:chemotaxis family two-component system response regulator Rcp1
MLRILVVEDNPADAQILKMALEKTGAPLEIVVVEDGIKAMEYLTARNPDGCDLVLLDLNLPRLSGFEVLDRIRSSEELRSLPVVVLSGSANSDDIERSYRAGANSYVCKPEHLVDILTVAVQIVTYWSQCVKLPSGSRASALSSAIGIGSQA